MSDEHLVQATTLARLSAYYDHERMIQDIAVALLEAEKRGREQERERCTELVDLYAERKSAGLSVTFDSLATAIRTGAGE